MLTIGLLSPNGNPGNEVSYKKTKPTLYTVSYSAAEQLEATKPNLERLALAIRAALALGADVSIQAATKYLVGHADAMLGSITSNARAARHVAHAVGQGRRGGGDGAGGSALAARPDPGPHSM